MAARSKAKPKCECGCGQSPAARTRQRKMTCGCGAAIVYLSRTAVPMVNATCAVCHDELLPVCLFDRALLDSPEGRSAVAELETGALLRAERSAAYARRALRQMRCSCGSLRTFGAGCDPTHPEPCPQCGSTEPATFGKRRAAVDDIPF